jgi:predicted phosphodiesterase
MEMGSSHPAPLTHDARPARPLLRSGVRLHILSDLHLEFAPFDPPDTAADAVILAGDAHPGVRGLEWAAARWPDRPLVYVPGNHEFYGHAHPRLVRRLEARAAALGPHVHVLSDRAVVLAGVRFLGATLWTDFELWGDPVRSGAAAVEQMADFERVQVEPSLSRCRPEDTVAWHRRSVAWLRGALADGGAPPTVVVTHHAPSARSLNPLYTDPVAAAFASHLDALVEGSGARYWVHGHTHHCVDYAVGGTRVVSNQRGYPDEPVNGFDPGLVLEL